MSGFCSACNTLLDPRGRCPQCSSQRPAAPRARPDPAPIDRGGHEMFPYRPRPEQLDIVRAIKATLDQGGQLVMESGTGTGKTICSLVGALEHAKAADKKILYLTRTISQTDQVMKEVRAISNRARVSGMPMLGRRRSCPLLKQLEEHESVPPHALSRICEDRKRLTMARKKGGCPYYADYLAIGEQAFLHKCRTDMPSAEEFDKFCTNQGACPYEARKALLPHMDVIAAPYVQVLSEDVRTQLLDRMKLKPEDLVLIVDEAHNVIDAARDQESFSITARDVLAAEQEARENGDAKIFQGIGLGLFCALLRNIMDEAGSELAKDGEARLGRKFLEARLRMGLDIGEEELRTLFGNVFDQGSDFADKLAERGKEPVSPTMRLGTLLISRLDAKDKRFLKTVSPDGKLTAYCLDPEETTSFFSEVSGAVHMSGTLQPLKQYADILQLDGAVMKTFPSPFPPGNKLVIYPEDVNAGQKEMRQYPDMRSRIEAHLVGLCNATNRNTMVFFRSYEMLRSMRPAIEDGVDRRLYWEESGPSRRLAAAIESFKREKDGVFLTVMGGKVAEGLDFPGQELDVAIIVGVPYPPPSLQMDELKARYDRLYGPGKGWEYTSAVPAVRKVQQAIGRLIRTETDRGAAVILDNRIARYAKGMGARPSADPVKDLTSFLGWSRKF